ncbi:PQQ-binding-like beta-propeller repeat protein [Halomontanus rarus]|uniref:outer membrane protein assembly factor BamB family protein n=1 Tax=Halomontanus rarus TaxID=3034020 RepID=UPI001A9A1E23
MPARRSVLAAGVTIAGSALAGCLGTDQPKFETWTPDSGTWPLPRYDVANTGSNPHATPPREAVEEAWSASTNGDLAGSLVADGTVVGYGNGGVHAFDLTDGDERWAVDSEARAAAIFDRTVYTVGRDDLETDDPTGKLRGFALADGEEVLEATVGGDYPRLDSVSVTESLVLVGDRKDRTVVALDRESGETLWELESGLTSALADDRLYVSGRGELSTYEPRSGRDAWFDEDPESEWDVETITYDGTPAPAVTDYNVYTGDRSVLTVDDRRSAVHAYDSRDGQKLWTSEPRGQRASTPAIVDDIGYAVQTESGREQAHFVALDLADGGERWHLETEGYLSTAVTAGNVVFASGGDDEAGTGTVLAVDEDGEELWRFDAPSPAGWSSGVVAVGDLVLVTTEGGDVIALEEA